MPGEEAKPATVAQEEVIYEDPIELILKWWDVIYTHSQSDNPDHHHLVFHPDGGMLVAYQKIIDGLTVEQLEDLEDRTWTLIHTLGFSGDPPDWNKLVDQKVGFLVSYNKILETLNQKLAEERATQAERGVD
jgi:hypothetical protein